MFTSSWAIPDREMFSSDGLEIVAESVVVIPA